MENNVQTGKLMGLRIAGIAMILFALFISYYTFSGYGPRNFWNSDRFSTFKNLYGIQGEWFDENNSRVELKDFKGKPAIVSFVYLECDVVCPRIVNDLKLVNDSLPKKHEDMNFVLFLFDDVRKETGRIKKFIIKHEISDEKWHVLTAEPATLNRVAKEFGIVFSELERNRYTYLHTNIFIVIAPDGQVKEIFRGLEPDKNLFVARMKEALDD